ncbi:HAMP domain-containing protein [Thalassospira sp. HF15]|uniref:sensor histidine kinase n=1 Tax=Thalassospira sp. HF15 TaxID=2722755 RepID=UPI001431B46E|nr:ATP-binding protein [Thalassospira sp. HF15]NIY75056.1 HAMP domain-containing protein [Thalassospira sp. HF15]
MSFRLKTVIGIAIIEIVLLAILVISGLGYLRSSNEARLIEQARTSSKLLATMTTDAVVALDLATISELVTQAIDNPGIAYARVRHADGDVLAAAGDALILKRPFVADASIPDAKLDNVYDVSSPIVIGNTVFGTVELGLSTTQLHETLAEAGEWMLGIAATEILLVAAFGSMLGGFLTRQLSRLQDAAARVAAGDFGYTMELRGQDELTDTAHSFNTMSTALLAYRNRAEDVLRETDNRRVQAEDRLYAALQNIPQAVTIINGADEVIHINRACREMYELDAIPEGMSIPLDRMVSEQVHNVGLMPSVDVSLKSRSVPEEDRFRIQLEQMASMEAQAQWEFQLFDQRIILNHMCRLPDGGRVIVSTDVSELHRKAEDRRREEFTELGKQRLESLGTLAGGIAHELNTPIQFVDSNLGFIKDAANRLSSYAKDLEDELAKNKKQAVIAPLNERYDVDFLRAEMPDALQQTEDGLKRITDIVKAIKIYSHPGQGNAQLTDLNEVIRNAVTVTTNQWRYVAELKTKIDDDIPPLVANSGELGQVLVNLIINAADAIKERCDHGDPRDGLITITACQDENSVYMVVTDNGTGMPEEVRKRIFDPFYTTKEIGKGTGQGLSISRAIICKNHSGNLAVDSTPGEGTRFVIQLPRDATIAA